MFSVPVKRIKLAKENDCSAVEAESGFHSEIDFSSSSIAPCKSISTDYVLSPVKRTVLTTRRASLNRISLSGSDHHRHQQSTSSSGYSSLLSSSSNLTSSVAASSSSSFSRQSRTPKKRKSEISESDENFYNSLHFISPLKKIPKREDKNCAKLILKEKSSSENVILSSTPIRTNQRTWQKFRSFHPEKIKDFDNEQLTNFGTTAQKSSAEGSSFNLSSFNFSSTSFNLTPSTQQDIPANIHNLWSDDIKPKLDPTRSRPVILKSSEACESQVPLHLSLSQSTVSSTASERKRHFNGRRTFDILGRLNSNHDIALEKILGYLDDESLLSISHVSKEYRKMIQSNKFYETKRQNYLKASKSVKENKLPNASGSEVIAPTRTASEKKRRKAFNSHNLNDNQMTLRTKPAPQSPSSRFNEMQKVSVEYAINLCTC
jgi:hypothetical protein